MITIIAILLLVYAFDEWIDFVEWEQEQKKKRNKRSKQFYQNKK